MGLCLSCFELVCALILWLEWVSLLRECIAAPSSGLKVFLTRAFPSSSPLVCLSLSLSLQIKDREGDTAAKSEFILSENNQTSSHK